MYTSLRITKYNELTLHIQLTYTLNNYTHFLPCFISSSGFVAPSQDELENGYGIIKILVSVKIILYILPMQFKCKIESIKDYFVK